eukprot:3879143-Alexandrium_andersonii.AAC.1
MSASLVGSEMCIRDSYRKKAESLRKLGNKLADGGQFAEALLAHLCFSLPGGFHARSKACADHL